MNPQPIKVPELRNVYQKELFTPGTGQTIDGFGTVAGWQFPRTGGLPDEPALHGLHRAGDHRHRCIQPVLRYGNSTGGGVYDYGDVADSNTTSTDWTTLQSQASAGNVDLIGRGTIQGMVSGLLYQPQTSNYISDARCRLHASSIARLITAGDIL